MASILDQDFGNDSESDHEDFNPNTYDSDDDRPKKSSKPAPPLPDIVNQGETSSTSILQKLRAGGTSQANTTRQTSEAMPEVVRERACAHNFPSSDGGIVTRVRQIGPAYVPGAKRKGHREGAHLDTLTSP